MSVYVNYVNVVAVSLDTDSECLISDFFYSDYKFNILYMTI